jgi:hypothetical protein
MVTLICSAERDLGRMDEISQYDRERGLVILAPHHAGQVAVNCGRSRGDHMKLSRRQPMIIKPGAKIRRLPQQIGGRPVAALTQDDGYEMAGL